METVVNKFGEKVTKWESHKHPTNPDFMQVVHYMHFTKPDGTTVLCWHLNQSQRVYHIHGISLDDAVERFTDSPELSESELEALLAEKLKAISGDGGNNA